MRFQKLALPLTVCLTLSGCGYTTKALLPPHIKTVSVKTFTNKIPTTGDVSEQERWRIYRPGMEVQITDAVANRLLFDAGVRIVPQGEGDAEISGELIDYERQGLRFDSALQIREFRSSVTCRVRFKDLKENKTLWDDALVGDSSHFSEGPTGASEDQAVDAAIQDFAIRVAQKVATAGW